jgi:Ca-activated chloride channel family protein
VLTHHADKGGFFTMILQPPDRVTVEDVTPKELVFVLDTSGSMLGFPIEKAKETMKLALEGLNPQDTFNLITFAGDTHILFPRPVPATEENLRKAQSFLETREGGGGTEMMKAIRAALDPSDKQDHIRVVCFMTDGYVGDDMAIISEVQKHPQARVFSFGIGSSVNRFLLDKMAEYGRGEVEYVPLNGDGSAAARRFHERVRNPLLTDISIDWGGLPVEDIYPKRIPDLFGAKPVILSGRYTGSGRGVIRLKGKMSGRDFEREIPVVLPESEPQHDVLATLWARARIDDLMGQDYNGAQSNHMRDDLRETITKLGLEYRLMTQFTSFVAVEEMIVTDGGEPRRVDVPVELPEGVSPEAFGSNLNDHLYQNTPIQRSVNGLFYLSPSATNNLGGGAANPSVSGGSAGNNSNVDQSSLATGSSNAAFNKGVLDKKDGTVNIVTKSGENEKSVAMKEDQNGLSPEEQKRQQLLAKLHPSILALIERLKKKGAMPSADEAKFIHDGKAEIQVWLKDKSPEALDQLKQLGFEVVLDPKTAKLVIGRLTVEKLEALAALESIRYVAPQLAAN